MIINNIKPVFFPLLLTWLMLSGSLLSANDATAVLDTGGIVLQQSEHIVMEEEELFISQEIIRVKYVFYNSSAQAITTRVAFPLPSFQEEPNQDMPLRPEAHKPLSFKLKIADEARSFDTEIKRHDGMIDMTHHWMQTFPAKERLTVEHEYKPAVGSEVFLSPHPDDKARYTETYCIESNLQKWIDRNHDIDSASEISSKAKIITPKYVHYVLKTGAHWKDAIKKFRLIIKKQSPAEKISLCVNGIKKQDASTFVLEKSNFIPKNDLKILFLMPNMDK
jgi:hypothetical protein